MTGPNVIIILAYDLVFSVVGPFGGDIDTPSFTQLSEGGIWTRSYYVTPWCPPSRAALLTGNHPHSVGIGVLTTDNPPNGCPGSLTTTVLTLAERLKEHGYKTVSACSANGTCPTRWKRPAKPGPRAAALTNSAA